MPTAVTRTPARGQNLQTYRALERRIARGDLDALVARWEWGKQAIEDGRTTRALAAATGVRAIPELGAAVQLIRSGT